VSTLYNQTPSAHRWIQLESEPKTGWNIPGTAITEFTTFRDTAAQCRGRNLPANSGGLRKSFCTKQKKDVIEFGGGGVTNLRSKIAYYPLMR
jgi:hypothetical protein